MCIINCAVALGLHHDKLELPETRCLPNCCVELLRQMSTVSLRERLFVHSSADSRKSNNQTISFAVDVGEQGEASQCTCVTYKLFAGEYLVNGFSNALMLWRRGVPGANNDKPISEIDCARKGHSMVTNTHFRPTIWSTAASSASAPSNWYRFVQHASPGFL